MTDYLNPKRQREIMDQKRLQFVCDHRRLVNAMDELVAVDKKLADLRSDLNAYGQLSERQLKMAAAIIHRHTGKWHSIEKEGDT